MISTPRLLVTSGSARNASLNRKVARLAAAAARERSAEVTELDLRSLELPLYDGDIEAAGMPSGALRLRDLFASHDGIVIASPEYNGFVTPLLVNTFSWLSRVAAAGDAPSGLAATAGKVAGLISASPGGYGGLRALMFLRSYLSMNLGLVVLPQTHSIAQAHQAFNADGALTDAKQQQGIERVVAAVIAHASALAPGRSTL